MGKTGDSRRSWGGRKIDDEAKGVFLDGLRRGLFVPDAARQAGFSASAFWKARKADPAFDEACDEALELSAAPRWIAPGKGRRLQFRNFRRLRFVGWRREVFLAHFAATCNETAAAEAAGVCRETVYRVRIRDSDFAAAHQAALDQGYVRLEAEAVRQREAAQAAMRAAIESGSAEGAEVVAEFERQMKLLARWERKQGGPGPRRVSAGRRQPMSFGEALDALERKLKALGIEIEPGDDPDWESGGEDGEGGDAPDEGEDPQ